MIPATLVPCPVVSISGSLSTKLLLKLTSTLPLKSGFKALIPESRIPTVTVSVFPT